MPELTDTQRAVLDFERDLPVWRYPAAKETAALERFGMSAVRYYAVLNALLDTGEALAYAPGTVRRLVRLREVRREARGFRSVG